MGATMLAAAPVSAPLLDGQAPLVSLDNVTAGYENNPQANETAIGNLGLLHTPPRKASR